MPREFWRSGLAFVAGMMMGGREARAEHSDKTETESYYTDSEPESHQERREVEALGLPVIEYRNQAGDGFSYVNTHSRDGRKKPDAPEFGVMAYYEHSLQGKESTVVRKIAHELTHQQWDFFDNQEKSELTTALIQAHGEEKIANWLFAVDPTYETLYQTINREDGAPAAQEFLVNEFVAWNLGYVDVPVVEAKSVIEYLPPGAWAELQTQGNTEAALNEYYQQNPDLLAEAQRDPRNPFYDTNDRGYFDLQDAGIALTPVQVSMLRRFGVGQNEQRARLFWQEVKEEYAAEKAKNKPKS